MELMILITIVSPIGCFIYLGLIYLHNHQVKPLAQPQQIELLQNHVESLKRNEQLIIKNMNKQPYGSRPYRHMRRQYYQNLNQQFALNERIKHLQNMI